MNRFALLLVLSAISAQSYGLNCTKVVGPVIGTSQATSLPARSVAVNAAPINGTLIVLGCPSDLLVDNSVVARLDSVEKGTCAYTGSSIKFTCQ